MLLLADDEPLEGAVEGLAQEGGVDDGHSLRQVPQAEALQALGDVHGSILQPLQSVLSFPVWLT